MFVEKLILLIVTNVSGNTMIETSTLTPATQSKASECPKCTSEHQIYLASNFSPELISQLKEELWAPFHQQMCQHPKPSINQSQPRIMRRG